MDVLTCVDEYCDMSKSPEDRYYPADYQYYQSYNSTYIPNVVELSDEIFDLVTMTEEEQQNGKEIPRFSFEMEEVDLNGEMYYRIVVIASQADLPTHHIFVRVYWSDDSGEYGYNEWNLADTNGVYGFYPGNSNSTITFIDQVDYNGGSVVSTFAAGDTIFVKTGFGNGTYNDVIQISYDMYPEEDDGISMSAMLYVGGQEPIISDDDDSENNSDSNDTEDDSDSSGLPSIGVIGTLGAIAVGFVAVIRREQEE